MFPIWSDVVKCDSRYITIREFCPSFLFLLLLLLEPVSFYKDTIEAYKNMVLLYTYQNLQNLSTVCQFPKISFWFQDFSHAIVI